MLFPQKYTRATVIRGNKRRMNLDNKELPITKACTIRGLLYYSPYIYFFSKLLQSSQLCILPTLNHNHLFLVAPYWKRGHISCEQRVQLVGDTGHTSFTQWIDFHCKLLSFLATITYEARNWKGEVRIYLRHDNLLDDLCKAQYCNPAEHLAFTRQQTYGFSCLKHMRDPDPGPCAGRRKEKRGQGLLVPWGYVGVVSVEVQHLVPGCQYITNVTNSMLLSLVYFSWAS